MGLLRLRNILTYKAQPNNERCDLICLHPDPRPQPQVDEAAQARVHFKRRYATDFDRGFPVKESSLDAFVFLIVAFLNIGKFFCKNDESSGELASEFFTLSNEFIRQHHDATSVWQKVKLRPLRREILPCKNEAGFKLIAEKLGIPRPRKERT